MFSSVIYFIIQRYANFVNICYFPFCFTNSFYMIAFIEKLFYNDKDCDS